MRRLLPLLLLAGCWSTDARIALSEEIVKDEMGEHHREVLAARDSVVAGELEDARGALTALRKRLPVPGVAEPPQQPLIAAVDKGAAAEDLITMSAAIGEAAATCGVCHRSRGVRPPEEAGPPPEVTREVASQMALHRWAMHKLWDGLVRADDAAFGEAATALHAAPMVPSGLPFDSPVPPDATTLEVRVHDLAASAARSADPQSRGRAFGQLLSTCQQCHMLLQGGPK